MNDRICLKVVGIIYIYIYTVEDGEKTSKRGLHTFAYEVPMESWNLIFWVLTPSACCITESKVVILLLCLYQRQIYSEQVLKTKLIVPINSHISGEQTYFWAFIFTQSSTPFKSFLYAQSEGVFPHIFQLMIRKTINVKKNINHFQPWEGPISLRFLRHHKRRTISRNYDSISSVRCVGNHDRCFISSAKRKMFWCIGCSNNTWPRTFFIYTDHRLKCQIIKEKD